VGIINFHSCIIVFYHEEQEVEGKKIVYAVFSYYKCAKIIYLRKFFKLHDDLFTIE